MCSILESILECIVIFIWLMCIFLERKILYCSHSYGGKVIGEMHISRGRRHLLWETLFCLVLPYACFLVTLWCFKLLLISILCCSHCIVFMCWTCIHPYAIVLYWLHVQMIICFSIRSLQSFPYDYHVFDQVAHTFHIMFTWSFFTCYIILILLSLDLSWRSNAFCASVSSYKYICSKFITSFRFRCEWVLSLFPNSCLSLESVMECFCHEIAKGGDC